MLKVNELFAGIGSQKAALERLGIDHEIVGIAEIDKDAILSYAAIHCDFFKKIKTYDFPSNQEMAQYLTDRNIGYDFKKNKPRNWFKGVLDKITGKATRELKRYYLASILSNNYGDISKIEKLDYADFWTYSFPCQDISVAGKQAGIEHGKTRSGLLYEVERLLEKSRECEELPKYLMLENVKNLVGKKFKPQFDEWIKRLDELGYNTYWKVLNAKNYGIPQNRERVFGISIRKDIDTGYVFPEPFDNGKRLKDILENEVDEKYYINNEKANKLIQKLNETNQLIDTVNPCDGTINEPKVKENSNCIKARYDTGVSNLKSDGTMVVEKNELDVAFSLRGCGMPWDKRYEAICRVYTPKGISPTVTAGGGGGIEPKVLIPQATKQGYIECNIPGVADLSFPDSKTRRGRVQDNGEICPTLMAGQQDICYIDNAEIIKEFDIPRDILNDNERQRRVYNTNGISPTVLARADSNKITTNYRIRKLTPLECWRLMGFDDADFYKAEKVCSNSQLYKQAGNSIVVDVLYYLFHKLFIDKSVSKEIDPEQLPEQMNIMDFIGGIKDVN